MRVLSDLDPTVVACKTTHKSLHLHHNKQQHCILLINTPVYETTMAATTSGSAFTDVLREFG